MFDRFCIPTQSTLLTKISEKFSGLQIETFIESIGNTKKLILYSVAFAFVYAYLFSFFLEYCAALVVLITMIGFYVGMAFLTYLTRVKYNHYKAIVEKNLQDAESRKKMKFFNVLFWVCVGLITVTLCFVLCFWNRIVLAIKVIKVSKQF